jgi:hypothetical protein
LINLKRRDYLGYLGIDGKIILKWILGKEMWSGFIWLGSSCGPLWTW